MSSPIGDGNGTADGCMSLIALAAVSVVLVLGVIAAVVIVGINAIQHQPQPAVSTSTRSTP